LILFSFLDHKIRKEQPGGARRGQEEPGGARRSQDSSHDFFLLHFQFSLFVFYVLITKLKSKKSYEFCSFWAPSTPCPTILLPFMFFIFDKVGWPGEAWEGLGRLGEPGKAWGAWKGLGRLGEAGEAWKAWGALEGLGRPEAALGAWGGRGDRGKPGNTKKPKIPGVRAVCRSRASRGRLVCFCFFLFFWFLFCWVFGCFGQKKPTPQEEPFWKLLPGLFRSP
jgi:hypothetical protein